MSLRDRCCGLQDWGLLFIRGVVGVVFIFHGAQKLFAVWDGKGMEPFIESVKQINVPYPEIAAYAAAVSEFGGGILLIIGLFARLAALLLFATMAVAVIKVHPGAFSVAAKGMEYALTLGVVSFGLCLTGAGRLSIDGAVRRAFTRKRTDLPPAV
jgi:putative oxidoreductase